MSKQSKISLRRTSKIVGPVREKYEDCTMPEKCLVSHCYKNRYPSQFCSRCRFQQVCDDT